MKADKRTGGDNPRSGHAFIPPLAVVVGVLLTAVLFWKARMDSWERFRIRFDGDTSIRVGIVEEALNQRLVDLESVRRFFYGSTEVDRQEFRAFLGPVPRSRPGVEAVAWVPKAAEADRARLESAARLEGLVDFKFQERDGQGRMIPALVREWRRRTSC